MSRTCPRPVRDMSHRQPVEIARVAETLELSRRPLENLTANDTVQAGRIRLSLLKRQHSSSPAIGCVWLRLSGSHQSRRNALLRSVQIRSVPSLLAQAPTALTGQLSTARRRELASLYASFCPERKSLARLAGIVASGIAVVAAITLCLYGLDALSSATTLVALAGGASAAVDAIRGVVLWCWFEVVWRAITLVVPAVYALFLSTFAMSAALLDVTYSLYVLISSIATELGTSGGASFGRGRGAFFRPLRLGLLPAISILAVYSSSASLACFSQSPRDDRTLFVLPLPASDNLAVAALVRRLPHRSAAVDCTRPRTPPAAPRPFGPSSPEHSSPSRRARRGGSSSMFTSHAWTLSSPGRLQC